MLEEQCPVYKDKCNFPTHELCTELLQYMKIVWCNEKDCDWNKEVSQSKQIGRGNGGVISEFEKPYSGICTRKEVGIAPEHMTVMEGTSVATRWEYAVCKFKSNRVLKGHRDFSKFLQPNGQVYGGNISPASDMGLSESFMGHKKEDISS